MSDANSEKAIWVVDFDDWGQVTRKTPFSTDSVCKRVYHLEDREEAPIQVSLNTKDRYHIDIYGTPEYVEIRKKQLVGPGVRIRPFPDQKSDINQVRESEGIEKSFSKYLDRFQGKFGTPVEVLKEMVQKRLEI